MPATVKHVPERTCVFCRTKRPKRELLRVVRTPAGALAFDPAGRQPGRGAYLCRTGQCWDAGLRKGRLEYALKVKLSPEDSARLAETIQGLPVQRAEG